MVPFCLCKKNSCKWCFAPSKSHRRPLKASDGWMEKFRTRHNIYFKRIYGEEKSVSSNEVTDLVGKLKSLWKDMMTETFLMPMKLASFTVSFRKIPYELRVKNVVASKFHKNGSIFWCIATGWETSKH